MIRRMNVLDANAVWEIFVTSLGYSCTVDVVRRRIADLGKDDHHVMIGFSAISFESIAPGVEALRRAWFG